MTQFYEIFGIHVGLIHYKTSSVLCALQETDMVVVSGRCISRDVAELLYSRDSERGGKTEILYGTEIKLIRHMLHTHTTHTDIRTYVRGGGSLATAMESGWKSPVWHPGRGPVFDLRSNLGRLSNDRPPGVIVVSSEGGGRRERNYLYGRRWYTSYGGSTNPQEESHSRAVQQFHPSLDLLDLRRLQPGM